MARVDADDADGDGISGRANYVWDQASQGTRLGRFGWKANQPSLAQQSAGAFLGDIGITTATPGRVVQEQVFDNKAPAYWLVNLDARVNLDKLGITGLGMKHTYFQLNVYNLFDKFYVGGFGGGLAQSTSTRTCNATSTPSCVPTVTVPMGVMADIGMPVGLTFAGRAYDDNNLLRVASAFESTGSKRRVPPRTPPLG